MDSILLAVSTEGLFAEGSFLGYFIIFGDSLHIVLIPDGQIGTWSWDAAFIHVE